MSHLAFARKYRPKDFEGIVGQEHIATTLKNAISQKNLTHAYLFCGPRGVGKTSTARILAKALNCKNGPTQKPCNKCTACREISEGRSLDVLEIDGASNRGIDEIRTLRENVKFAPSSSRFKIYIIDEVHMLTTEAFNALLKTLEEPPFHVKFFFATTQPHKVLSTILSRCQRFDFRKITVTAIVDKLKILSREEKIKCEDTALCAVAKSADGSMRDAEVILDQMNSFSKGKIKLKDVNSVLGLVSSDVVLSIVDKLLTKSISENLLFLDSLFAGGKNAAQLVNSLIDHFRNMMLMKCNSEKLVELTDENKKNTKKQTEKFSIESILYCISVLSSTSERIKRQGMGRLFLEMALIKLSEQNTVLPGTELIEKLKNIEHKLRQVSASSSPRAESSGKRTLDVSGLENSGKKSTASELQVDKIIGKDKVQDKKSAVEKMSTEQRPEHSQQVSTVSALESSVSIERINKFWPHIIQEVKKKKISLGLYLSEGKPLNVHKNTIEVGFLQENEFHRENLEHSDNLKMLEQISSNIIEQQIKLKLINYNELPKDRSFIEPQEEAVFEGEEEEIVSENGADINEFIQSALDVFNGRIVGAEE